MSEDIAKIMDALTFVRRHTSNSAVLTVCDALSARLRTAPVADPRPVTAPLAADVTLQAPSECPVCAAHKKALSARVAKHRSRTAKGKRKGKAKPPLSPVIPTKNNAPASSPEGSPPVTHRQQSTPE